MLRRHNPSGFAPFELRRTKLCRVRRQEIRKLFQSVTEHNDYTACQYPAEKEDKVKEQITEIV